MKQIQWYPGHMAKTKKQVKEKIKLVDVVLELLDARIPYSSQNPVIKELIGNKPRVILLNKADLSDPIELDKWVSFFEAKGVKTLKINALNGMGVDKIKGVLKEVLKVQIAKEISRGRKERPIRTMILGIPNVGKSTLINRLANKKKLIAEDRPGVTRHTQYIRVGQDFELLDTPGILWPKFDNDDVAFKLAITGAIKDNILPIDEIAIFGFKYLYKHYLSRFEERYSIKVDIEDILKIYEDIGRKRGCLLPGNEIDYDRVNDLFLHDFRHQKFGKITLDYVKDYV
ncbi:MAG: ribosome biogenesis GTPase YlqF [Candidatus Izimaplasma sp.]|nr:ribosome biogenesis GTPase YlqF [Candidatus Izimaplasma bacterium]